jgi:hypothetical protein
MIMGAIIFMVGAAQAALGIGMYMSLEMFLFGFALILSGIYVIMVDMTTPCGAFLSARFKRKPVLEVERKDGYIDFVPADYVAGSVISKDYGTFAVDPAGVKGDTKSKVNVLHCVEGIGTTMNRKMINITKALTKQYNVETYPELKKLVASYGICKTCNKEGIFKKSKLEEIADKDTGAKKTTEIMICPNCKAQETYKQLEPPLVLPDGKNVEAGYIDRFFKSNSNPILQTINSQKMAANELAKQKKAFPIVPFAMITGLGFLVFMCALAYIIIAPQLGAANAGAITPPILPVIGG